MQWFCEVRRLAPWLRAVKLHDDEGDLRDLTKQALLSFDVVVASYEFLALSTARNEGRKQGGGSKPHWGDRATQKTRHTRKLMHTQLSFKPEPG